MSPECIPNMSTSLLFYCLHLSPSPSLSLPRWTGPPASTPFPAIPFPNNNQRIYKRMQVRSCHHPAKNFPVTSIELEKEFKFLTWLAKHQRASLSSTPSDIFLLGAPCTSVILAFFLQLTPLSGSLYLLHFCLNNLPQIFEAWEASFMGPEHKCFTLERPFQITLFKVCLFRFLGSTLSHFIFHGIYCCLKIPCLSPWCSLISRDWTVFPPQFPWAQDSVNMYSWNK